MQLFMLATNFPHLLPHALHWLYIHVHVSYCWQLTLADFSKKSKLIVTGIHKVIYDVIQSSTHLLAHTHEHVGTTVGPVLIAII